MKPVIGAVLDEDRAFARQQGHSAAAVSATMGKGKILGYVVDRLAGPTGGPVQNDINVKITYESARQELWRRIEAIAARTKEEANPAEPQGLTGRTSDGNAKPLNYVSGVLNNRGK